MEQAESLIAKRHQPRANERSEWHPGYFGGKEARSERAKALQSIRLLGIQPDLLLDPMETQGDAPFGRSALG